MGSKLGYHGFLEGKFRLAERVRVGAWIGYTSSGKIEVTGDGVADTLDFVRIFTQSVSSF